MRGDFTHDRFDSSKHFTRVLKQQGRVDLDADWNEHTAISLHLLRTFISDVLGRSAGPRDGGGFGVLDWSALTAAERATLESAGLKPLVGDFVITPGRYYVDGLLVENEGPVSSVGQSDWAAAKLEIGQSYLVYLDVWERHISAIEDDSIREVALGGPDTCTRVKTIWQVKTILDDRPSPGTGETVEEAIKRLELRLSALNKALAIEKDPAKRAALLRQIARVEAEIEKLKKTGTPPTPERPSCDALLEPLRSWKSGRLKARVTPIGASDDPCVLPPESRYRGLENQLYRIEIHRGSGNTGGKSPTFKWSRDNGSGAARWLATEGNVVRVSSSRGFEAGQWIELTDDAEELQGSAGFLTRMTSVDGDALTVETARAWNATLRNPSARRWDQTANDERALDEGAVAIVFGTGGANWITIEDGIEVQFEAGDYRAGDYWLIPARVITGGIEWPVDSDGTPLPQYPTGIDHHYAALALIDATAADPFVEITSDCRCLFAPLACITPTSTQAPEKRVPARRAKRR